MSGRLAFNFDRALQASAYLLRLENKRISALRLLKLLYIAEREWLAETGQSITGDRACAMKHGPVFSTVYDLIKGTAPGSGRWDDHIHRDGYNLTLVADPGRTELSKGIIEKLEEVTDRHREDNDFALSDVTHTFGEWEDNWVDESGSSFPIRWQELLEAQGKPEMIEVIRQGEAEKRALDEIFGPEP